MPSLLHAMPGALRRDRQPVKLARQSDGEVADVDHLLHLAEAFLHDLPGLQTDQRAELRLLAAENLAEEAHQLAATRRRNVAPLPIGRLGPRDGAVDLCRRHTAQGGEPAAVDRRVDREIAVPAYGETEGR